MNFHLDRVAFDNLHETKEDLAFTRQINLKKMLNQLKIYLQSYSYVFETSLILLFSDCFEENYLVVLLF